MSLQSDGMFQGKALASDASVTWPLTEAERTTLTHVGARNELQDSGTAIAPTKSTVKTVDTSSYSQLWQCTQRTPHAWRG